MLLGVPMTANLNTHLNKIFIFQLAYEWGPNGVGYLNVFLMTRQFAPQATNIHIVIYTTQKLHLEGSLFRAALYFSAWVLHKH